MVRLHLNLDTAEEPRSFIKTLPSLKSILDAKIAVELEKIADKKEKVAQAKQMREDMHCIMDKHLQYQAHHL